MHKLIDTSSSFFGTGISPGQKLFKIKSGVYANRIVALFSESASAIVYSYADPPYTIWAEPITISNSSANQPCTGLMDDGGNLYVAFTSSGSDDLKFVKLPFNAGNWTSGTVQTICSDGNNYNPSIVREDDGDLWVSWSHYNLGTSQYTIRVKKSTNDGVTWGSGPTDTGTALSTASANLGYTALALAGGYLNAVYCANRNALNHRRTPISSEVWTDEEMIYNSSQIDDKFSIASSPDNKIGVAFVAPTVPGACFKEFDGLSWSGLHIVDYQDDSSPALRYLGNIPYIFYGIKIGENQYAIKYTYLSGVTLVPPNYLLEGMRPFDSVLLYDDSAGTKFQNRTAEAASVDAADIFHPTSAALIADDADSLYVGMDKPFFHIHSILSTAGSGGVVSYSYWNGANWESFAPYSGAFNFNSSPANITLWIDLDSVPSDWQKNSVNGINRFWVKIETTSAFSTPPIGSQITAVPDCRYINMMANF